MHILIEDVLTSVIPLLNYVENGLLELLHNNEMDSHTLKMQPIILARLKMQDAYEQQKFDKKQKAIFEAERKAQNRDWGYDF